MRRSRTALFRLIYFFLCRDKNAVIVISASEILPRDCHISAHLLINRKKKLPLVKVESHAFRSVVCRVTTVQSCKLKC